MIQRSFAAFAVLVSLTMLIAGAGCGSFFGGGSDHATPDGWSSHKDPMGFSVDLPPRWTAKPDAKTGRVEIRGDGGEQLLIWPVFSRTSFDSSIAGETLLRLSGRLFPGEQWGTLEPVANNAVRVRAHSQEHSTVSLLTWITTLKGSAACIYAAAGPDSSLRESQETFAKVFQSFRISGAPAADPPAPVHYVEWTDPREHAFTLAVPTGWAVSGGLYRFAPVDTRPAVEAISPDGQIHITIGDAEIPAFTLPNQMLEMAGFPEGSWYSPGYGVRMMVRHYLSGADFASDYIRTKAARGSADLEISESRDRDDATRTLNAIYSRFGAYGVETSLSAGESAFTCRKEDQPLQGYYFAGTLLTRQQYGGIWAVQYLSGYLAANGRTEQAQEILESMIKSFQFSSEWLAMQQNVTASTSRIVARTNQEISNIITGSYWSRQNSMDELSRRRSNATLGVEDVIDPETGDHHRVESGSNYYWVNPRGVIVGTNTDTKPTLDFRELMRLP